MSVISVDDAALDPYGAAVGDRICQSFSGGNGDHDIGAAVSDHGLTPFPGVDFDIYAGIQLSVEYIDNDIVQKPTEFTVLSLKIGWRIVGEHPLDCVLPRSGRCGTKQKEDDAKRSHLTTLASANLRYYDRLYKYMKFNKIQTGCQIVSKFPSHTG